jgi:hypothetical protein
LHPNLYSSKFPPRTLKCFDQGRDTLPNQPGGSAGRGDEGKFGQAGIHDAYMRGKGRGQTLPDALQNGDFAPATVQKTGEARFGR